MFAKFEYTPAICIGDTVPVPRIIDGTASIVPGLKPS